MNAVLERLQPRWPHLIVAVVLTLAISPTPVPRPLVAPLRAAAVALAGNRPAAAADWLEAALAFQPDFVALHPLAGQAALAGGDPSRALAHLREADRLLPPDPSRTCLLGLALLASGDPTGAIEAWEAEPELFLNRADILEQLAQVSLELEDRPGAIDALARLVLLVPADPEPRLQLGLLRATLQPETALPDLRLADELAPGGSPIAQSMVRAIEDSRPEQQPAYTLAQVGQALARNEEWQLAAWAFEEALVLQPDYAEVRAYLGLALDRSGRDGLEELQAAAAAAPGTGLPHTFLGLHWSAAGDPERALTEFTLAARLDPTNPALAAELGRAHAQLGDVASAISAYRLATDLAPQDPGFWLLLAEFSLSHEIEIEALALPAARNAAVLRPEEPAALEALGYAYFLLGDLHLSERFLVLSANLSPLRPQLQYRLGLLREAQGDLAAARTAFETAARLDPGGPTGDLAARTLEHLSPTGP